MSLDAAGQTLPVKADQTAAHKPLSKRGDAESGAADNVATSGTTTTLRRGHADTSSSSSHTTADGSSTPRWVTPKHALTAISKSGDADDRVGDAAPRWAESSHTNAATSASGDAQPSSLPRQPSSAPLSSDAMDVQSLLGSLSYGRSASAARRPLGESQSSPLIGTGRGTYEPLSSRQQGPPTRTTPVLSNGHSHRSLQSDSSTSFSSVGAAAAAATSTIADVGGTGALSSLSEFGNAMHRWPHATDPAATPRRWASTVSTSVSSVGPPLPEGLDAIKARLDALSSPVETYARRGAEAQHPQHPDASSFAARRIRELEAERSELRTKEAEQLRVVRACLAERDELRRADESRTQALESFQRELMVAVERFADERARWLGQVDAKTVECDKLKDTVASLRRDVDEAKKANHELIEAKRTWQQRAEAAEAQLSVAKADADGLRSRLEATEQRMSKATADHNTQLAALRERHAADLERSESELGELRTSKRELRAAVAKLEADISSLRHERDTLRSDAELLQARHESERASIAAKAKSDAERAALAKVTAEKERAATELAQIRETHRAEMTEAVERFRRERTKLTDDAAARLAAERDRAQREMADMHTRLRDAQTKLESLQAAIRAHDALDADRIAKLGSELQAVLKQQHDSVARVASKLTSASQQLSDETRSVVNDVTSELHDVATLQPIPSSSARPADESRGVSHSLLSTEVTGASRPLSALDRSDVARLPSSPGHGLRLLHEGGADVRPSPSSRSPLAASAAGTTGGVAYRGYSDPDLVSRAMANLGATSNGGAAASPSASASVQWRSDHYGYMDSVGTGGYGQPGGTSYRDSIGDSARHGSPSYNIPPSLRSPRSLDHGVIPSTVRHTRPASGAAREEQDVRSPGRASVSSRSPRRKAPGERDYDKPWLAGIRTKPSAGKQAVDEVYRLLREAREARERGSASVNRAPPSPPKSKKGPKVWK